MIYMWEDYEIRAQKYIINIKIISVDDKLALYRMICLFIGYNGWYEIVFSEIEYRIVHDEYISLLLANL